MYAVQRFTVMAENSDVHCNDDSFQCHFLNPFLEKGYSLIAAAEHDVVYFGVLLEALAKADDELIKDILSYSGVFIEEGTDSLGMFV